MKMEIYWQTKIQIIVFFVFKYFEENYIKAPSNRRDSYAEYLTNIEMRENSICECIKIRAADLQLWKFSADKSRRFEEG